MHVLIVEDEALVSELYERLFEFKKYKVTVAANGEAGLEKARALLPDAVLLDIMLPTMDGIEVLRQLKADDKTKHIPVVMLTNIDDDIALATAMQNGAVDYLIKSNFTADEIIEKVEKLLKQSR